MTIKEQKSLSSISGRKWLKNTLKVDEVEQETSNNLEVQDRPEPLEFPDTVKIDDEEAASVQTIEVDVPDMSSLHSVAISPFNYGPLNAKDASLGVVSDSVGNDLSEKAADWAGTVQTPKSPRTSTPTETKTGKTDPKDSAVDVLCDAILERFPLSKPAVVLFAGSEPNIHVDEVSARVASRLADRELGKILLVDSDLKGRALSLASGLAKEQGILDVKERAAEWKPLVYGGASSKLDFMPAGIGFKYCDLNKKADLIKAIGEMKLEYQFILVSVGDAHSVPARVWSDICDGSYLLVSMKKSNETVAQSAVAEMQSCGARLLGCVVTDVE